MPAPVRCSGLLPLSFPALASGLSLRDEKPAVGAGSAVLGGDVGQLLLQRLAVDPGAAGHSPSNLALCPPQLVRVLLGHCGLDAVLNAGDLGLGLLDHPLQLPDLVYLHVQFVDAHCVNLLYFVGFVAPELIIV